MKYEFHPEAVLEFEAAADFLRRTPKGIEDSFH